MTFLWGYIFAILVSFGSQLEEVELKKLFYFLTKCEEKHSLCSSKELHGSVLSPGRQEKKILKSLYGKNAKGLAHLYSIYSAHPWIPRNCIITKTNG